MIFPLKATLEPMQILISLILTLTQAQMTEFPVETEFSESIEVVGTVRGNEQVTISASVTDIVSKISVSEGVRVQKGDHLIELTNREQNALLAGAIVKEKEAKLQLNRSLSLLPKGAATQSDVDTKRRDYEAAKSELDQIQSQIKDRKIIAPFDGVIGIRYVSEGALIKPGDALMTLVDDSKHKVDFYVPEFFFGEVSVGQSFEATAKTKSTGLIESIDSVINESTRSFLVRGLLDGREFAPGMFVRIKLTLPPKKTVSLPEEALQQTGSRTFIRYLDEKIVKELNVSLVGRQDGRVYLHPDDALKVPVIVKGAFKYRAGQTL